MKRDGALATTPSPRDRHVDIEQSKGTTAGTFRRLYSDRADLCVPSIAATVITARFARAEIGGCGQLRQTGLGALHRLLVSRRHFDCQDSITAGPEKSDQR